MGKKRFLPKVIGYYLEWHVSTVATTGGLLASLEDTWTKNRSLRDNTEGVQK